MPRTLAKPQRTESYWGTLNFFGNQANRVHLSVFLEMCTEQPVANRHWPMVRAVAEVITQVVSALIRTPAKVRSWFTGSSGIWDTLCPQGWCVVPIKARILEQLPFSLFSFSGPAEERKRKCSPRRACETYARGHKWRKSFLDVRACENLHNFVSILQSRKQIQRRKEMQCDNAI